MTSPHSNLVPLPGRPAPAAATGFTFPHVLVLVVVIGFAIWLMTALDYAPVPALGLSLGALTGTMTILNIGRLPALLRRLALRLADDRGTQPGQESR